ncbi:MAG: hypothetical protein IJY47_06225 [Clostridia bacterium]|nr:hypothetical protein [Clostridia bacterium]
MYQWIPPKNNKTAQKIILILLVGAAVLFGMTALLPDMAYRWAYQLIAIGLLTLSLFLVTRYITRSYLYRICEGEDGARDLEIVELTGNGKRQTVVCRIGLGGITQLTLLDLSDGGKSETLLAEYKRDKKKIFDYCVDLQPSKSCLLRCREGGEELTLRLEYDPILFEHLTPVAAKTPISQTDPTEE